MDKDDCIEVLLSTLRKPLWKSNSSTTDWDLKNVLWKAGHLLTPEQAAGLLADVKRRALIRARQRTCADGRLSLWGIRITEAGEDWLVQAALGRSRPHQPAELPAEAEPAAEDRPLEQAPRQSHWAEALADS